MPATGGGNPPNILSWSVKWQADTTNWSVKPTKKWPNFTETFKKFRACGATVIYQYNLSIFGAMVCKKWSKTRLYQYNSKK